MKVKNIAKLIEKVAPVQLQESYDNAGLQVGDPEQEVTGVLTTLDVTEQSIEMARSLGANLIVSHHPLLFRGVKQINPRRDYISRVIIEAIRQGIAIYSAHTNLDNAPMGVNRKMGEVLGLSDIKPLAPLSGAQIAGLDTDFAAQCGSGIVGELPSAMSIDDFIQLVKQRFQMDAIMANTAECSSHKMIRKVALCGGAGSEFVRDAIGAGADVFLTGEMSYHLFFGYPEILLLTGGHFETERFTSHLLCDLIHSEYPELQVTVGGSSSPIQVH